MGMRIEDLVAPGTKINYIGSREMRLDDPVLGDLIIQSHGVQEEIALLKDAIEGGDITPPERVRYWQRIDFLFRWRVNLQTAILKRRGTRKYTRRRLPKSNVPKNWKRWPEGIQGVVDHFPGGIVPPTLLKHVMNGNPCYVRYIRIDDEGVWRTHPDWVRGVKRAKDRRGRKANK